MNNPTSREINLGDAKLYQNLISSHQVAHSLLLLQVFKNEFDWDQSYSRNSRRHTWLLTAIDRKPMKMTQELENILHSAEWQA